MGIGSLSVSKKQERLETVSKKADSLETDLRVHYIVRNFAASKVTNWINLHESGEIQTVQKTTDNSSTTLCLDRTPVSSGGRGRCSEIEGQCFLPSAGWSWTPGILWLWLCRSRTSSA